MMLEKEWCIRILGTPHVTVARMEMAVFWVLVLCSLALVYQTTQCYNPEYSYHCAVFFQRSVDIDWPNFSRHW
jgi:hypothetical protein